MARRRRNKRRFSIHPESYWQQIVENRIPLVGPWFREIAAVRLAESARNGSRQAAQSLARALDCNDNERVREIARQTLNEIDPGGAWNAVWEVWLQTRSPELESLLRERNLSAAHPPAARAYSHLLLGKDELLVRAGPEIVPALMQAGDEPDTALAGRARAVLANLSQKESREAFYELWSQQRKPWQDQIAAAASDLPQLLRTRVLVLLLRAQYERLNDERAEVVRHLVSACTDPDERIASGAACALRLLSGEEMQDELCRLWVMERQTVLEEIITQKGIVAGRPTEVRLMTALLNGRSDIARKTPPEQLPTLLTAASDPNERITAEARAALTSLAHPESREALCEIVINHDDPVARQAALEAGYLPEAADRRALFLLLTGQVDDYAALDFDQRFMRVVYSTASPPLRQRIVAAVQSAGRVDFLNILTGPRDWVRPADWSDDELCLLVNMLAREGQWDRLWKLAFEAPFLWSVEIVRILTQSGWSPEPSVTAVSDRLVEISSLLPEVLRPGSNIDVPIAIRSETLRVRGRVNDIAFSPVAPLLAIGTGQRQVVLWNYRRGAVETVLREFDHSISRVTFNPAGLLFAAERSSPDGPCRIKSWDGNSTKLVGEHSGSVTDLCPYSDDRLLSVGNDRQINLWDINRRQLLYSAPLPNRASRARQMLITPDGQRVFFVHERICSLSLPELDACQEIYTTRSANREIQSSAGRCAAFIPPDSDLVVGQHNGQVLWHRSLPNTSHRVRHLLTTHRLPVVEVRWLKNRGVIASAGCEGEVRFLRWPGGEQAVTLSASDDRLTAMEISAEDHFMATGSRDSTITLWDLRTDRLSDLLRKPLGAAQPSDLALLNAILSSEFEPDHNLHLALIFVQEILQHRLRFDIQVADIPVIQPGAFDIQLDEVAPKNV